MPVSQLRNLFQRIWFNKAVTSTFVSHTHKRPRFPIILHYPCLPMLSLSAPAKLFSDQSHQLVFLCLLHHIDDASEIICVRKKFLFALILFCPITYFDQFGALKIHIFAFFFNKTGNYNMWCIISCKHQRSKLKTGMKLPFYHPLGAMYSNRSRQNKVKSN